MNRLTKFMLIISTIVISFNFVFPNLSPAIVYATDISEEATIKELKALESRVDLKLKTIYNELTNSIIMYCYSDMLSTGKDVFMEIEQTEADSDTEKERSIGDILGANQICAEGAYYNFATALRDDINNDTESVLLFYDEMKSIEDVLEEAYSNLETFLQDYKQKYVSPKKYEDKILSGYGNSKNKILEAYDNAKKQILDFKTDLEKENESKGISKYIDALIRSRADAYSVGKEGYEEITGKIRDSFNRHDLYSGTIFNSESNTEEEITLSSDGIKSKIENWLNTKLTEEKREEFKSSFKGNTKVWFEMIKIGFDLKDIKYTSFEELSKLQIDKTDLSTYLSEIWGDSVTTKEKKAYLMLYMATMKIVDPSTANEIEEIIPNDEEQDDSQDQYEETAGIGRIFRYNYRLFSISI